MADYEVNELGENIIYYTPDGVGLSLNDIFFDSKPQVKRKERRITNKPKTGIFPPDNFEW